MQTQVAQLSNGIRLVHTKSNGEVTHCGFVINVGSRNELEYEQGLAHFIEHSFFKGTKKRKTFHILSSLDSVGGELNAYTTKEETVLYAAFRKTHHKKAFDILSDLLFNSQFPVKEIEKEKDIIIDEIHSYLDSPSEQIFDDFEEYLFKDHPIGRNILGTVESVRSFKRQNVLDFIERNYSSKNIVFSYVGSRSFNRVFTEAEKAFGSYPIKDATVTVEPVKTYHQFDLKFEKDTHQCHVLMGNKAPSVQDEERKSMYLLNNILGGPALNSRLNLNIREKYGFTYNLESNYTPYSDSGYFNIYFGTDKKHIDKTYSLVLKELKKFKEKPLGTLQLHKAKVQLMGHLALSNESKNNLMINQAKSLLVFNKIDTIKEVYEKIEKITAEELMNLANQVFKEEDLSILTYL